MTDTGLYAAALSVALFHTVIGVDHYLPFVVVGRARKWPIRKVAAITAFCGLGHVVGSVLLGMVGIAFGVALGHMEWIESVRGSMASWGLIAFGLAYMSWAFIRMQRAKKHTHPHAHADGEVHVHEHDHAREHLHAHVGAKEAAGLTVWGLFVVFALGPCEPLIPVLMVPAFAHDWWSVLGVTAVFSVTTIGTMVSLAVVGSLGLSFTPSKTLERYANVAAGGAIAASGLAIQVLGI
jgi:ABC-type nickel/cobalt efflux system permease component RcnA